MKKNNQLFLDMVDSTFEFNKADILSNVANLIAMHKSGLLGGEIMPEDAKPSIIEDNTSVNYHFLTLPMALNYQRNSYKLWEAAAKTYLDPFTVDVFDPLKVVSMPIDVLRDKLLSHKLALQPVKHINTWFRICEAIVRLCDGDIRKLFERCSNDVVNIRNIVQFEEKKSFPYLSGHKIFNYWLYVIEQYTPTDFINRQEITIAPDTHIIQSSLKLGLINDNFEELSKNRTSVSDKWKKLLKDTEFSPIDIHTPLWLWSRMGFPKIHSINS